MDPQSLDLAPHEFLSRISARSEEELTAPTARKWLFVGSLLTWLSPLSGELCSGNGSLCRRVGDRSYRGKNAAKYLLSFLFCISPAFGEDLYVRPNGGTYGTENGSSWTNAFDGFSDVVWGSGTGAVGPGDTLWIAGGTYTQSLNPGTNGTSGNPITMKRVSSTDAVPVAASGWNPSFDAQVVISNGTNTAIVADGSWFVFDGQVQNGILATYADQVGGFGGGSIALSTPSNNTIIRYIDLKGPGGATAFPYKADNASVNFTMNPRSNECFNMTIQHCTIRGSINVLRMDGNVHDIIVEHCIIKDNISSGTGSDPHENLFYFVASNGANAGKNVTIRYNDISNWEVEGIDPYNLGSSCNWYIYGNTFHDANSGARCFWIGSDDPGGPQGPFYIYNNTFVGVNIAVNESRARALTSNSIVQNNIYWQSKWSGPTGTGGTRNYNYSDAAIPGDGPNSITNGTAPFVNEAANDFRITSAISNTKPRDKGTAIANANGHVFNVDKGGTTRGADGALDIGAYEYESGASATPTPTPTASPMPPTNLRIVNPSADSLTFLAAAGTISTPFTSSSGNVSQSLETTLTSGGRASYLFTISDPGNYTVTINVDAPHTGANSLFVNIDAEPTDPATIWDILPATAGFENRTVAWRGNGTFDSPEIPTKVFNLSVGTHRLIIVGREPNTRFQSITILPAP